MTYPFYRVTADDGYSADKRDYIDALELAAVWRQCFSTVEVRLFETPRQTRGILKQRYQADR